MVEVQIIGGRTTAAFNQSPYRGLYIDKLLERPRGVEEREGTRERAHQGHSEQVRLYKVPWSEVHQFRQWALGFSYSELVPGVTAEQVDAATTDNTFDAPVDSPLPARPVRVARIRRVLPAQDPVRPWLFCSGLEMLDTQGAWVEDPAAQLIRRVLDPTDLDRRNLTGQELTGEIAYVSNTLAGSAATPDLPEELEQDNEPGEADGPIDVSDDMPQGPRRFQDGYATIRLTYTSRDYRVLPDLEVDALPGGELRRWVTRTEEFSLEALPLAKLIRGGAYQLRFAEGPFKGDVVPEAGVKQLATATLVYTHHEVPDRPWGAYRRCLGRVNSEPFDGYRGAPYYPAGTLLCLPWRTKEQQGMTGRIVYEIAMRFAYRPQGWNYLPSANSEFYLATWTQVAAGDPTGEKIYKSAAFGDLFNNPPPPADYT